MNLADMLSYADIRQLSSIASFYNCDCNGNSKKELIQSILSTMTRRDVFEQKIQGLTVEDIRFLNSLMFDARDSFSLEELVARVKQSRFIKEPQTEDNPREMISRFKLQGWLFNGYSTSTKYLFQFPKDLRKRLGDALTKRFTSSLDQVYAPDAYRDEQQLIIDDIRSFLLYLHHNEAVLTADGTMYRKSLQNILGQMSVKEEMVSKGGWRFGYGRKFKEYPNRFSFIYDFCFFHDYIAETDGRLVLTDLGTEAALERQKIDLLQVYKLWLRLYKGPIPNLQSLVQWVNNLCGTWVTVQSLKSILCNLIKPYYYDDPESILDQRILRMMMHLGLVRLGESESAGAVVCMTKRGSEVVKGIYVPEDDTIALPEMR